jgi:signal transduction histidine kinase
MSASLKVLLVEDDVNDRMAVHQVVGDATQPLEIIDADTMAGALEVIESERLDCILIDHELPDGSAVELLRKLERTGHQIPVVVLTSRDDETSALDALELGAQDYLLKSQLDTRSLVRAIRHAARRQEVQVLQHKLVDADRLSAIGRLAAGVAHEINNPACYILANLGFIRENLADIGRLIGDSTEIARLIAESDEAIADSIHGTERICQIVEELRPFSRGTHQEGDELDLNKVVESALALQDNEIRHRARLVKQLGELPSIRGDRAKLSQVAMNLIENATQSIEEGAADRNTITITTSLASGPRGDDVILTVADSGCGIDDETRKHIFEPFFTTKPRGVGTGLGLAVCAESVNQHGGAINVRSAGGKGTTVEVRIPVRAASSEAAAQALDPGLETPPLRVLLIDDDRLVRSGLRRLLTPTHQVIEAQSGSEALELLGDESEEGFDVILCDLMMPEVDGPAVYDQLATKRPEVLDRIVFLTGGAFTTRVRDFIDRVDALVLEKPVSRTQLLDALARTVVRSATDDDDSSRA